MIYSIVAYGRNKVIGKDNALPWGHDLPADLKHFRELTTGNTVVMGRKTYESIGRPLPNRQNIVITRDTNFVAEGCEVVLSLEQAIEQAKYDIYIIGGASIYSLAEPYIDVLCATEIMKDFDGDTVFELSNPDEWKEVSRESHEPDESNAYPYDFVEYKHEKTKR